MSLKKIHDKQPDKFEFTETNQNLADKILKKYPPDQKKSAVMPLLYLAQEQNKNWVSIECIEAIADTLQMNQIDTHSDSNSIHVESLFKLAAYSCYITRIHGQHANRSGEA